MFLWRCERYACIRSAFLTLFIRNEKAMRTIKLEISGKRLMEFIDYFTEEKGSLAYFSISGFVSC